VHTRLVTFVDELREVGIPVSMVEAMDAATAIEHTDLADPEALRATLAATLVKNARHLDAFDIAFNVFFGLLREVVTPEQEGETSSGGAEGADGGGGDGGDELFDAVLDALQAGDRERLLELVRQAVDQLAGIQPGRPVGGRYYFYRVMRRIDADRLAEGLIEAAVGDDRLSEFDQRLAADDAEARVDEFRDEVRREIVRRLVADRGAEQVARTLRSPLIEDIDLMHATREELERIEHVVGPLARKLATRLAQRRKRGRRGRLDVRRTIRRSLAHGGVLLDPAFKPPRISKPELILLCDVSGSMATFARFTMQLTFSLASQFSRVRTFAFIDGIDEVTEFFGTGNDFADAMSEMAAGARLVWQDGHSDYGAAFQRFEEEYGEVVTARSTVIITGDARNNYRTNRREVLEGISHRARSLFWLNPENRKYWDTGDSVMSAYTPSCTQVFEVRTLRQLETFVESVALGSRIRPRRHLEPA
jgi:uncharacterized protein with von Willebrand factor type A (vWA) domain